MKLFILLFGLILSLNIFACSKHQLDFMIENKSVLKTDDFKLISFNKDENQKWVMDLKIESKKALKKLGVATKNNIGKYLNLSFDRQPIASFVVSTELKLPNGKLSVVTSFDTQKVEELKSECSH